MTNPVTSPRKLYVDPSSMDFQAKVIRAAVTSAARKGPGDGGKPAGTGNIGTAQAGPQGGNTYQLQFADGLPPVSDSTAKLIEDAQRFDREQDPKSPESARKWKEVQDAVAGEVVAMLPTHATLDISNPDQWKWQFTPELTTKLQKLNTWAAGSDRLAQETKGALEQVDVDLRKRSRDHRLDDTIGGVDLALNGDDAKGEDGVSDINDDHNFIRKGWDGITGGGAGDDFEEFLKGKIKALEDFDKIDDDLTDEEFEAKFQQIMGSYTKEFKEHAHDLEESDEAWHTVGEVGRVVAATAVGIVTTAATGGNAALGFAAALGTYEVIDLTGDLKAVHDSKDMYADGHSSILAGLGDAIGLDGDPGMTKDHLKSWGMDNAIDIVSSTTIGKGTSWGIKTAELTAAKIGAKTAVSTAAPAVSKAPWLVRGVSSGAASLTPKGASALTTRVVSTSAAGFTGQAVNGAGALTTDAIRLGFDNKLFTSEGGAAMLDSLKTQGIYLGTAPVTGAFAGAIPVFRTIPAATAGANPTYRVNWLGVGGQWLNDAVSNFGTAWLVDGKIDKADAIAALGGTVPGTIQNIAFRPDTQQRIDNWRANRKFPPDQIKLTPIALTITGVRVFFGLEQTATGYPILNLFSGNGAVALTALRSSGSKWGWYRGNHRLIDVFELALQGKTTEANAKLDKIESGRRWYGMKIRETSGDPTGARKTIELLATLGEDYQTAVKNIPDADVRALMPDIRIRDWQDPQIVIDKLKQDQSIPAEVRNVLQSFDPDTLLLRSSNIVEGLLTDPEFVINAIETFGGKKLNPSEVDAVRQIVNVHRLLEGDPDHGGYTDPSTGVKWADYDWKGRPGNNRPVMLEAEIGRLQDSFLSSVMKNAGNVSPKYTQLLQSKYADLDGAWRAYVRWFAENQSDPASAETAAAQHAYDGALNAVPVSYRSFLPDSNDPTVSLQNFFKDLSNDPASAQQMPKIVDFSPNTKILNSSDIIQKLLADPGLGTRSLDDLQAKLTPQQRAALKLIRDVQDHMTPEFSGGQGYNHTHPGVMWNEMVWRTTPGDKTKVPIVDPEMQRLNDFVDTFLNNAPRDAQGNEPKGVREALNAWKSYLELYSQTQHDLVASDYEPGIKYKAAEQELGSSMSPDTLPGYMLKAGAFAFALNLFYSWAIKPFPTTGGSLGVFQRAGYVGDTALAIYNPLGQMGYLRALGAMTKFKAEHPNEAEYKPSDKPEDMEVYKKELADEFKRLERNRKKWNLVSDVGSLISFTRNLTVGASYWKMGMPELAIPALANAALSLGWFMAQRSPVDPIDLRTFFNNHPKLQGLEPVTTRVNDKVNEKLTPFYLKHPQFKGMLRWFSIFGGAGLSLVLTGMTLAMAEEIKKNQGEQGGSAFDLVSGPLDTVIGTPIKGFVDLFDSLIDDHVAPLFPDVDPSDDDVLPRRPLPDRA